MTVAILGGGLTGLTIANLQSSEDVRILEKENDCGGLCRSNQENGYTFDIGGSHVIFSKDNDALEFMKKTLGDNISKKRRNTKVLYKEKSVKYPFENGLCDLPKQDNFECLLGFFKAYNERNNRTQPNPNNFKEWMYYTFGSGIAEKYLIPYNEKIWKLEPAQMGLAWVGNRIPQPPIEDVIKASLGLESEGYVHQLYFYYPIEGGIQALIKSLEEKVHDKITLNFKINNIEKTDNGWVISNGSSHIKCEEIISTIPLFDLISSLQDVPKTIKDAVAGLKYTSLVTILLGIDSPKLNDISWIYIPDTKCISHRVSFPSNYSDKVAPPNKSCVLAEVTYNENSGIARLTNKEILENIVNYLDQNNLINKNNIEYTKINRAKYAYVVNDLNYERNIRIIKAYLKKTGIHLVGRFSEWEYYNMDACVRSAMNFVSGWRNGNPT